MANKKVTDLDSITTAPISGVMHFVDTTDSTQNAAGSSFKVAKVGFTDALVASTPTVIANTAKVGITTVQALAVVANTAKVGYTETLVSANVTVAANAASILLKTDKGTFTGTSKDLENLIVAASTGATGTSIVPSSPSPAGTGVASYIAIEPGTYTNYGGLVVNANSFALISRSAANAFSISQTAFDLTTYARLFVGKNIFNKAAATVGKFISNTNGSLTSNATYSTSDFIPVTVGQVYKGNNDMRFTCYFDSNRAVIQGGTSTTITTFTVPSGVSFIRVTLFSDKINIFQLEKGTVSTSFTNYALVVPDSQLDINNLAVSLNFQSITNVQKIAARNNILAAEYDPSVSYTVAKSVDSTITGKYINSVGALATGAYDILVFNLSGIDRFRLQGTQGGTSIMNYAFYTDAACTILLELGTINVSGTNTYDLIISKASASLFLGVTSKNGLFNFMFTPENLLAKTKIELNNALTAINTAGNLYTKKESSDLTITDKYIHSSGSLNTDVNYKVFVYSVDAFTNMKVQGGQFTGSNIAYYSYYLDVNCTSLVQIGTFFATSGTRQFSEITTVPAGANYLAVTVRNNYNIGVFTPKFFIAKKEINCFGDSLTFGAGSTGLGFPQLLSSSVGVNVNNFGVGGENSLAILARQGSVPMKILNAVTIPSGLTAVSIGTSLKSTLDNSNINPLVQGGNSGINPCVVSGIECNLTLVSGTYFLTRTVAGTARTTATNEILITAASKNNRNSLANVFYLGTNTGGWTTNQSLIDQYKLAISFSDTENFLCIGLHSRTGYDEALFIALESDMVKAFGSRYINLRKYLVTNALGDAGITPTAADNNAIALGNCPPSLLADTIHFNDIGYGLVSNLIYQRIVNIGIINNL